MRLTGNMGLANLRRVCMSALSAASLALVALPARALDSSFLYALSDTNGPIPANWVRLAHDPQAHELFVFDPAQGTVRVFNRAGMETYSFGDDEALGSISDIAVLEGGEVVLLSHVKGKPTLLRCNFRGEPLGTIEIRGAPPELAGFVPDRVRYASGKLYLAASLAMQVVAITPDGAYAATYDATPALGAKRKADAGFTGFGVDASGNVLFTVAPLFEAFVLSPDGTLRSFGVRGSSPGKFNVVGGIAADAGGNLYVTDVLRSVVMVFDPAFEFRGEFGYRGSEPGNLVAPRDLVVGDGQVFVTQAASRGVSVFRVEPQQTATGS
jgi:DNA-binding beta-propeller fold protein YncE